jgi:hypothetical protein
MKKLLVLILLLPATLAAQLPVQIFGGHKAVEYNFLWFKDVDARGKFSLFNFTFFTVDYQDRAKNVYEIYQVGTFNFNKTWGLSGGGRFVSNEFAPIMALSYQLTTRDLYLNLFPSVQYFGSTQTVSYSLFGLLFYRPKISDTWRLFNQLTFEPLFTARQHVFSYQQVRIGLEYKSLFQFGLGGNFDQVGSNFAFQYNLGVFIRKEL